MALKNLSEWLIENEGFLAQLDSLRVVLAQKQIPLYSITNASADFNLDYLLTCASILAQGNTFSCQDAALRIASFALLEDNTEESKRLSAALILDTLYNYRSINLAIEKGLLDSEYIEKFPLRAVIESSRREISNTVELYDESSYRVNNFQLKVWNAAIALNIISVSAPTSVGKSFILELYIREFILKNTSPTIIFLVPTRALISEVEKDLSSKLSDLPLRINVSSLPAKRSYKEGHTNVYVFTQERLHIFYNSFETPPTPNLLIVDEAHKIGDGYRGVVLQQVIETSFNLNSSLKIIFASPFTNNPEILLENFSSERNSFSLISNDVTVNQNLFWVNQKYGHPKKWELSLCLTNNITNIGELRLESNPSTVSKRLSFVVYALTNNEPGNIVYVNGAADAEKCALQLFDLLPEPESIDPEIINLIELCSKAIHSQFALNFVLTKGIAFHYGNIPLLIRSEIERLFSKNIIRYLVCTSTLVEGVNMSCRNIFIRGPKKGRNKLMNAEDFWNLAGRAGRWGKEFQGNIFCIDANMPELWEGEGPPRTKSNVKITRTTDTILEQVPNLIEFIHAEDHLAAVKSNPDFEYVFSYLTDSLSYYGSLAQSPFLSKYAESEITALNVAITEVLQDLPFSTDIIHRNPGISPILMKRLWERFDSPGRSVEELLLSNPSSNDSLGSFTAAFTRISQTLSDKLGFTSAQASIRALLVIRWMQGFSLARLITDRLAYLRRKNSPINLSGTIREVMRDVEEIARYHAPRLLSCYNDLLKEYLITQNREDLLVDVEDIALYLELGLNQQTQISLVSLGLSRTAAVMLSEYITEDNLNEAGCVQWLKSNTWTDERLPVLIRTEISNLLTFQSKQ